MFEGWEYSDGRISVSPYYITTIEKGLLWEKITYTKTIKYPTVCPIYLIKWPFFYWSKKYINVDKNPPISLYMLKYIRF